MHKEETAKLYVTDTAKDVEAAVRDLEAAVKRNMFVVRHVHDLQQTLKEKGGDFPNSGHIREVCNPQRAYRVLTTNMAVSMVPPCRISVFQEGGTTKIGMIRPTAWPVSGDSGAQTVVEEVERETVHMIDEAK
jgi:uncharacterized protein (DUF302 family)